MDVFQSRTAVLYPSSGLILHLPRYLCATGYRTYDSVLCILFFSDRSRYSLAWDELLVSPPIHRTPSVSPGVVYSQSLHSGNHLDGRLLSSGLPVDHPDDWMH